MATTDQCSADDNDDLIDLFVKNNSSGQKYILFIIIASFILLSMLLTELIWTAGEDESAGFLANGGW